MKKLLILVALIATAPALHAGLGWFQDYVKINFNNTGENFYWIGSNPSFGTQLNGASFGEVNSLVITGCDMRYWSDDQDRTGGAFYYKIMSEDGTTQIVAMVETLWVQSGPSGNDYQGLQTTSIVLLNGLIPGTTYQLHIWAKSWGSSQGDSYLSNGGANYVATFKYMPNTFTGTGDWISAARWSAGVPSATADAVVAGIATISTVVSLNNLTISNGFSLTINPTKSLSVNGTLTNSAGAGGLVIKSASEGTGSLIHYSSGVAATIERYITGAPVQDNATRYHLVSHPFTEAYLSGVWLDSYLFDCDEPSGTWIANGTATTTPMSATKGYMIYYPAASKLYSHTGTLSASTSSIPITYNAGSAYPGFNLVPNVYASALDFDNAANWTGNITNKIWIWSSADGNYGTHIRGGTSTNSASNIIPLGQAFFVQASASGDLLINPAARVHNSSQSFLKGVMNDTNSLRLKASANNFGDEIVVQFREDATTGYDDPIESIKRIGQDEAPQLSSVASDNSHLSINALPVIKGEVIVPLDFTLKANATVTFTASSLESFDPGVSIYLEDRVLNKIVNLREEAVYTFSYISGSAADRFRLRFSGAIGISETAATTQGKAFVSNGHLFIDVPGMLGQTADVMVYNAPGQVISKEQRLMNGIVSIDAPHSSGIFIVSVASADQRFVTKVFNK